MQVDPALPPTPHTDPTAPEPHLSEAFFHEPSDTVRFQVAKGGAAVNASVSRQALRHHFGCGETQADLLACFQAHCRQIHAVVTRRLNEGALEPVMLREAHFTLP